MKKSRQYNYLKILINFGAIFALTSNEATKLEICNTITRGKNQQQQPDRNKVLVKGGKSEMMKHVRILVVILSLAGFLCYSSPVNAESASGGAGPLSVSLDFAVNIPSQLFLQVGTAGATVDTITFDVLDVPGTGSVAGVSSGANPVPVRAVSTINAGSTITLTADSSIALDDGSGNTIPFSEISWAASGDFLGGRFNDANGQVLRTFTDSSDNNGNYLFAYDNDTQYPAGNYSGTVVYTLSSP